MADPPSSNHLDGRPPISKPPGWPTHYLQTTWMADPIFKPTRNSPRPLYMNAGGLLAAARGHHHGTSSVYGTRRSRLAAASDSSAPTWMRSAGSSPACLRN
eukprot:12513-Chlamydomonas_euryale.AAC.2